MRDLDRDLRRMLRSTIARAQERSDKAFALYLQTADRYDLGRDHALREIRNWLLCDLGAVGHLYERAASGLDRPDRAAYHAGIEMDRAVSPELLTVLRADQQYQPEARELIALLRRVHDGTDRGELRAVLRLAWGSPRCDDR